MPVLTMSEVIDEALDRLYVVTKRPRRVKLGANALSADPNDRTFTLEEGSDLVGNTTVLEFGSELVLVTNKSDDSTPVYTCDRGYEGTTVAAHNTADDGLVNPIYPRREVQRFIERCVQGPLNRWLPAVSAEIYRRGSEDQYIALPENTVRVLQVRHQIIQTGAVVPVGGWSFHQHLPVPPYATSKALQVPPYVMDDDELIIDRQVPYAWSQEVPTEDSTIEVPYGAEELLALYAVARMVSGREVSRLELDRVEQWNKEEAIRQGVNVRMVRELWADFYRGVEDARVNHIVPKHRPFVKMPKGYV